MTRRMVQRGAFLLMAAALVLTVLLFGGAYLAAGKTPAQEMVPDGAAQEQDCSDYCVAGPITDNRDGTLSIKMGSYTQLEQALRELEEALA